MYLPAAFREDRLEVQHQLIRSHPLGLIVSHGPGGLLANSVPLLVYADEGEHGTLRAHVARANAQWGELQAAGECLVVFQGEQEYITPTWLATKQETHQVVPTWNYVTVHAWGVARVIEDPAWLLRQLQDLTHAQERSRPAPWQVTDAPESYVQTQMKVIVGIEIPIGRIEGKWKVSQNRNAADRAGIIAGLQAQGGASAQMAAIVAARGRP